MQFWGEVKKMPRFDNAYALIIGINSYQHINPLSKAVNDAVDVRNLLIDENTCGYHPDNVCLLTDTQATKLVFFETISGKDLHIDYSSFCTSSYTQRRILNI